MQDALLIVIFGLGSLGSIGAALAAWYAAKQTQKTIAAQIISEVVHAYGTREFLSGLRLLFKWKDEHGSTFAEDLAKRRKDLDDTLVQDVDNARRFIKHHFIRVYRLRASRVISKAVARECAPPEHVNLFDTLLEPMEFAINEMFDNSAFEGLRRLYKPCELSARRFTPPRQPS